MITNSTHLQVISQLDRLTQGKHTGSEKLWVQHYLGSNKPTRCLKSADVFKLAKNTPVSVELIDSLYQNGTTFDELALAANLVGLSNTISLKSLDKWLNYTVGWAEIDSLCQSNFSSTTLLDNWSEWQKFLIKLSDDKNISKRRASLVLLCKSLRQSEDSRLFDLAILLVDKLKFEKEILITKAVSWILRSAVKHHGDELAEYLEANKSTLPKIAYRETMRKLTTGKKN